MPSQYPSAMHSARVDGQSQGVLVDAASPLLPPPTMTERDMASMAHERWRRLVGLALLLTTVILWTASNFMASVRTCSIL